MRLRYNRVVMVVKARDFANLYAPPWRTKPGLMVVEHRWPVEWWSAPGMARLEDARTVRISNITP